MAVLRLLLGLTVEEFAALIGKSTSAVTSLETGRLALSEETAFKIKKETGVAVTWLLHGNAKEKPYQEIIRGTRQPYTKEVFEQIQARKLNTKPYISVPKTRIVYALEAVTDWLSVYNKAEESAEGDLARYLMRKFLDQLIERLGKDDAAFMRVNAKTRIIPPDGSPREFVQMDNRIAVFFESDKSTTNRERLESEILNRLSADSPPPKS